MPAEPPLVALPTPEIEQGSTHKTAGRGNVDPKVPVRANGATASANRYHAVAGGWFSTSSAVRSSRPSQEWPDASTLPDSVEAPVDDTWTLVEQAQDGSGEAFGRIYDRYVDTIFRYIYFRVASRPLAEDLTSETFLRALRRIASVTWQGRDLGAWLVTIARNLIADHYKSGRYRLEVITGDMVDADREEHGVEGQPETAVLDRLTNAILLEAVKRLNPEQQECVVLRFLHGLSVTETARAMGKNEGAIKALQYRAVRSLGRLLPEGFTS